MITPQQAYEIASQWGSYSSSKDPGRVFYTFAPGDARPQSESHRAWCLAHTEQCIRIATARSRQIGTAPDADVDVDDLLQLRQFFHHSPLKPEEEISCQSTHAA